MKTIALIASLIGLTACAQAPVIGEWESNKRLRNGKRNKLELREDFTGSAKIFATPIEDETTWIKFTFDVTWEDLGAEFEIDLNCDSGPCSGNANDHDQVCEALLEDDGDEKLDCKADRKWKKYPFQWRRDL